MSADKIRVFVVDDHPMIRMGLAAMIQGDPAFDLVGEAGSGKEAVRMIPPLAPDVVLLDLLMPQLDGLAVLSSLRPGLPRTRFVMLSSVVDPSQVQRAMAAGASGFLSKTASSHELINILHAAYAGQRVLSPEATEALIDAQQRGGPGADLTERERELLRLMAQGRSNQEIAVFMGIAMATVKFHITNILSKLGVSNRTEAVLTALKHKLVDSL
jgi:NarL family two-component system response regulator LiaR